MRTKSETRRQAILSAAAEVFQEAGFDGTSMEDVRRQVGYSKATLYSYFPSKEELFFEMVLEATEAEYQATLDALDPSIDDLEQALGGFGNRFLSLLYLTPVRAVRRLVVAEAGRSDLGKKCYEIGPVRSLAAVADFLLAAMEKDQLRRADPHIAALHLRGLLESEWIDPFMFQTGDPPSSEEIGKTVARAVSVFMAAYGPAANLHTVRKRQMVRKRQTAGS